MKILKAILITGTCTFIQTQAFASAPSCISYIRGNQPQEAQTSAIPAWKSNVEKMIRATDDEISRVGEALNREKPEYQQNSSNQITLAANRSYVRKLREIFEMSDDQMLEGISNKKILSASSYNARLVELKLDIEHAQRLFKLAAQGDRADSQDRAKQYNAEMDLEHAEANLKSFKLQNRSERSVFQSVQAKQAALIAAVAYIKQYQGYYVQYVLRTQEKGGNWSRTVLAKLDMQRFEQELKDTMDTPVVSHQ